MNERGNLILLAQSEAWPAAIRRQTWPFRLTWALDVDDLIKEGALRPGSLAVVEFPERGIAGYCRACAKLNNNPFQMRLVAVGNHEIWRWDSAIRAIGFSDVFWSTSQIERLGKLATTHFQHRAHGQNTLEETVRGELPWKPANSTSTRAE